MFENHSRSIQTELSLQVRVDAKQRLNAAISWRRRAVEESYTHTVTLACRSLGVVREATGKLTSRRCVYSH